MRQQHFAVLLAIAPLAILFLIHRMAGAVSRSNDHLGDDGVAALRYVLDDAHSLRSPQLHVIAKSVVQRCQFILPGV
jgi:hypothetical protein